MIKLVAVGVLLVKAGTWLIVMLKFCVTVPAALVAVVVPVKVPNALGVPVMVPSVLIVNPVGRAPAVTEKVGAGVPLPVQVKL